MKYRHLQQQANPWEICQWVTVRAKRPLGCADLQHVPFYFEVRYFFGWPKLLALS